jgi:hypothetical protein
VTADEALRDLISTLEQIREIFPAKKSDWDDQPLLRLAVERLWITCGNLADAYRLNRGLASGIDPWAELVGFRHLLAHALPGDLSSDRVFADTQADLDRLMIEVRRHLEH